MRRLTLREAIEAATTLYEELNAHSIRLCKVERNQDVLRTLCLRQLVLDSLTVELNARHVLPVTLNTLSTLFAQVYSKLIRL